MDTLPEPAFDDLTRLAALICGTSIAIVNIIGGTRQFFKSCHGFELGSSPLAVGFCPLVVARSAPLVIPDTLVDPAYATEAAMTGHDLRFYAGVPLVMPDGHVIGTLCVLDEGPRSLGRAQYDALGALGRQVVSQLQLRWTLAERLGNEARYAAILESAIDFAIIATDLTGHITEWNEGAHRIFGWSPLEARGRPVHLIFTPEDRAAARPETEMRGAVDRGRASDERWHLRKDGTRFWANGEMVPLRNADGAVEGFLKILRDRTEHKQGEERRNALVEFGDRVRDLDDAKEIAALAVEFAGRTLGVSRAGYGSIDVDKETITIERDWTVPGVESLAGTRRFRDYGSFIDDLKRGKAVIIADVEQDRRTSANAKALNAIGARALINVPVKEHGGTVALFFLDQPTVRQWSAGDTAFVRNMADRTRAAIERARAERESRNFRSLVQQSSEFIGIFDLSGKPLFLNKAAKAMVGDPSDLDWSEVNVADLVPAAHLPPLTDEIWPALRRGEQWQGEMHLRHRVTGALVPIWQNAFPIRDERGELIMFASVSRDISAQKQAEAAVQDINATLERRVEERTRERDLVWRASQDLIVIVGFDGTYRSTNPAWTDATGYSPSELAGLRYDVLMHPDDVKAAPRLFEALSRGEIVRDIDIRIRTRDGTYRLYSWFCVPNGDELYASGRDITERRALEEQLRQSQKLEAVGQLTGGVAHDFNNMLTIIRSSVDLLRRRDLPEDRRRRYVDAISDTADRASKLTGQLLAFARRQALKPEVFDAARRVTAVGEMIRTIVGARIAVETRCPEEPRFVNADASQFDTALVNMAMNARDAMNGEGHLSFVVEDVQYLPKVRGHLGGPGRFVSVAISDTGSGIAPEIIAQVFEPFFTTKEVGQGTGLGLSQVFGFAKQSGGEVAVTSEVGRGTTFTLYLPQMDHEFASEAEVADGDLPIGGMGARVLVVEDNEAVGLFSTQTLEELGYRTVWAANAQEALTILAQDPRRVDAVFSDVVMPGMSGLELGEEIQRLYPHLPVVLTSGYSHVLAKEGAHGFELLNKPYSVEALSRVLRRAVKRP